MTGAELLAQVREVWTDALPNDLYCALDGCVLLTAEEAEKVRQEIAWMQRYIGTDQLLEKGERDYFCSGDEALALLGGEKP